MDNHTFIGARFIDTKHTTCRSFWRDNNDETITRAKTVLREEGDGQWENLLKLTTLEEILRNTFDFNKAEEEAFKTMAKEMYPPEVITEVHERVVELEKRWFDFEKFLNGELGDEDLFRLKILIFETEILKNSKDRALKTKIRKSKDAVEVISLYHSAIQTAS